MKITFFGATREVTGSCYLVETQKTRLLVDCGMFQGSAFADKKNFEPFHFDASTIDGVVVTHGHLDHVGRLPKLIKEKFSGKIYLTPPTRKIAHVVLEDAEQVMEEDFKRMQHPKLYEKKDVEAVWESSVAVDYSRKVELGDLSFRFRDAGHIFGSAFIEIQEQGGPTVVFSGDVGNKNVPILKPTAQMGGSDALILESTYGNRIHEDESTREAHLKQAITHTINQGGVLVIPAFAVERTQQLLYELNHLVEHGHIPAVDTYLDSPMAIKISNVIKEFPQYYNNDALKLAAMGDDMFSFPGLHVTATRDQSKEINDAPRPKVIIAGAGMMNGGRIQHHLVRYLGDARSTVLIIGYQAHGTLGRKLYSGEKTVDVLGERIEVKATIMSIGAYSAHADQAQLLHWIRTASSVPKHIYCTHGEEDASAALASRITEELHIPADVPRPGQAIEV